MKRTDLKPVIRRMTDGNGAYNGKEIISSDYGDEAYIYTSYIGVPNIFKTVIAENAITAYINGIQPMTVRKHGQVGRHPKDTIHWEHGA